jgi:hypothetical protein
MLKCLKMYHMSVMYPDYTWKKELGCRINSKNLNMFIAYESKFTWSFRKQ